MKPQLTEKRAEKRNAYSSDNLDNLGPIVEVYFHSRSQEKAQEITNEKKQEQLAAEINKAQRKQLGSWEDKGLGQIPEKPSDPYIHSIQHCRKNPGLSQRDKLEYLKDSLEGKAKQVVAGFKLTEVNYNIPIQMLKGRFGREVEIGRAHYEEVTKLQPVLRKNQEQYSDVFVPLIENKLPENIRLSVLHQKDQQWNIDELLVALSREITIREKS
eukprot:gene14907-6045_t